MWHHNKSKYQTLISFLSLLSARVHTGPVSERCDWGQSEPPLRSLLWSVRLSCSGQCIDNNLNYFFEADSCNSKHSKIHCASAGVCLWHSDRMAPHLQHLPVRRPVGAERPAAVGCVALRGGRHGKLVRQGRVCHVSVCLIIFERGLSFCVVFACSPRVYVGCLWELQLPPPVQRHAVSGG